MTVGIANASTGLVTTGPSFDANGFLTPATLATNLATLVELRCITSLLNTQGANLEQMRAEELHSVNPPGAI